MATDITPPVADDEKSRHVFYSAISSSLDSNTKAMGIINESLDEIGHKHETLSNSFRDLNTSIATTIKIMSAIGVLLGASAGAVVQQTWKFSDRVDRIERTQEISAVVFKPHETIPDQIAALKQRINSLEDELASLRRNNNTDRSHTR